MAIASLLAGVAGPAPTLRAGIEFAETRIVVEAPADALHATGSFAFRNSGAYPVSILSIKPSCGCTSASCDRSRLAPGESGFVKVDLTVGSFVGRTLSTFQVVTDDPKEPAGQLVFECNIGEAVAVERHLVHWPAGIRRDPKTVDIDSLVSAPVSVVKAFASRDDLVRVVVVELEAGRRFRVNVIPLRERGPFDERIAIDIKAGAGQTKEYAIYARGE